MKITKTALIKLIQEEFVNERRSSVKSILSYERGSIKDAEEGPLKTYVEWMSEVMIQKDREYMRHIDSLRKEIEELKAQKGS